MKTFLAVLVCALLFSVRAEEVHSFSADVAKMLHIIVHSLYQNPEIFLRELISNSADALTKYRLHSLSTGQVSEIPYEVKISLDKEKRTISILDTGVGMTKQELMDNLGSLGASGTKKFLEQMSQGAQSSKLIGQFGVGFYSVFLVGDSVKVSSKHDNSTEQWVWESNADGTYKTYEDPRETKIQRGTEIMIELKQDAEQYTEFDTVKKIVQKYSEFIDFPIYIQKCTTEKVKKSKDEKKDEEEEKSEDEKAEDKKEDEEEEEITKCDWEHINEQKPIWLRNPSDVSEDDYNNFYKAISKDSEKPLLYSHFSAEGEVEFKSILFIPGKAPANLHDPGQGLMNNIRLYVRRVFITDEFKDLLPRYLNFIKGVVDSDDLPLNVSREILQENRLLKVIRKRLTRKALSLLSEMVEEDKKGEDKSEEKEEEKKEDDEEKKDDENTDNEKKDEEKKPAEKKDAKYGKFWEEFGKSLRLGVIEDASNRARLTKLLRYKSSKSEGKFVSLEEYVARMHEKQKGIFYLTGESVEKIEASPLIERALAEEVEVLFMTDAIDEYVVGHITEFNTHKLINLAKAVKLRDETDKEKKIDSRRQAAWEPFLKWAKEALGNKVEKVTLSKRLGKSPAIVVSPEYGVTAQMEKIMKAQALATGASQQAARRILELNPKHSIVDELRRRFKENEKDERLVERLVLLFDVGSLQSGFELDDLGSFSSRLFKSLKNDLNLDEDIVDEDEYPALPEESEKDDEETAEPENDAEDEKSEEDVAEKEADAKEDL